MVVAAKVPHGHSYQLQRRRRETKKVVAAESHRTGTSTNAAKAKAAELHRTGTAKQKLAAKAKAKAEKQLVLAAKADKQVVDAAEMYSTGTARKMQRRQSQATNSCCGREVPRGHS